MNSAVIKLTLAKILQKQPSVKRFAIFHYYWKSDSCDFIFTIQVPIVKFRDTVFGRFPSLRSEVSQSGNRCATRGLHAMGDFLVNFPRAYASTLPNARVARHRTSSCSGDRHFFSCAAYKELFLAVVVNIVGEQSGTILQAALKLAAAFFTHSVLRTSVREGLKWKCFLAGIWLRHTIGTKSRLHLREANISEKNIVTESPTARREKPTFPYADPLMHFCDTWKRRPLSRAGSPK